MKLSRDAAQIFGAFVHQADLTHEQEQMLLQHGDKEIDRPKMEQILSATPANFEAAKKLVRASRCDENAAFLTSFNGELRSIREHVNIQRRNQIWATRAYDPQEIPLELDPRGRFFLCASTTKFEADVDRPRPVLLKIVARASGDDGKPTDADKAHLAAFFDSCKVQKNFWNMREGGNIVDQDVMWVGGRTASVVVHEKDEREIGLGNGVAVITYDKELGEISRVGKIDPINIERTQTYMETAHGSNQPNFAAPVGGPQDRPGQDTTPPQVFNRAIRLSIAAKDLPRGAWIDDPGHMDKVDVGLRLGARWLMEAGASGSVSVLGASVSTKVAADDWYYNGSAPSAAKVEAFPANVRTIRELFSQNITTRRGRVSTAELKFERPEAQLTAENLSITTAYFAAAKGVKVAGADLVPMGEPPAYSKATGNPNLEVVKRPAAGQGNKQDMVITLSLRDFLQAGDQGASTKGWTLDVGIRSRDAEGKVTFTPAKGANGEGGLVQAAAKGSGAQDLQVYIPGYEAAAKAGFPIEVIVRDAAGLPVSRYQIPLKEIDWAKDVV